MGAGSDQYKNYSLHIMIATNHNNWGNYVSFFFLICLHAIPLNNNFLVATVVVLKTSLNDITIEY